MNIVSFVGFADAGKSTAAMVLASQGYVSMSFADAIKDCLAAIFCWPRDMLEGNTPESRIFRETIDPWWAEKLGIPNFTPRYAMRNFGTECVRHHFHNLTWVFNVERRLMLSGKDSFVFGDVRHPNEINLTRQLRGKLIRIKKGDDPVWFGLAKEANAGDEEAKRIIRDVYKVHESEMAWIGCEFDHVVNNDGTIGDFVKKIANLNL